MERKLSTIFAADVVGYSRLMEQDEAGTFDRLRTHRKELFEPEIAKRHGRVFKLMGDGLLAEFDSVVDAVECAVLLQREMAQRNASLAASRRIDVRIGINLGDVIVEGEDRHGDGVNIATRLEKLAEAGGIILSGTAYDQVKTKIDVGFEFLGERQVKNIAEPVRVYRVLMDPGAVGKTIGAPRKPTRRLRWPAIAAGALLLVVATGGVAWFYPWEPRFEPELPLPDKPSVAVLPFANLSDDRQQSYFADGIAEDLMTDLSRLSGLFVIARHSAFAYRGQDIDVRKVGRELGVRHIVEGSIRRTGEQVRINVQLIDAATGGHLWAERYDGSMADIFALQDHVTKSVVAALALRLTSGEQQVLSGHSGTSVPQAYDAFLRGWEHYQRTTPADFAAAIPSFEEAIGLDPSYSRAQAALAMVYFRAYDQRWTGSLGLTPDAAFRKAREYLDRAKVHPTSTSHQVAGNISRSRGWYDDAVKEFQEAIALDPSDSWSYAYLAYALIYARRPAEAEAQIETAMRLDPHFPSLFVFYRGLAQFEQGRMEDAALTLAEAVRRNADDIWPYAFLAASYGHLGRLKDGADAIAALSRARVRQGGVPFVMLDLMREGPEFVPPPDSPLIRGLLQIGIPYNFDSHQFDSLRLTGEEVEALFFGHRIHGRNLWRGGAEYGVSVAADGTAVSWGPGSAVAGTAKLEGDRICFVWSTTSDCASILRNPGGSKAKMNEYLWFQVGASPFSRVE